ncbi:MAG: helix-turn-helix transcriptional regulator [Gluconacetobacter diazotrophicus]|nr:helix-turn-helix transcriptional regulator [Gluconacetobacter diazotrophicus]
MHDQEPRFRADCPSRLLLDEVADKWSILVLATLDRGPARFNAMTRLVDGISKKSLTAVLRRLERNGIVIRRVLPTSPVSVEYEITPLGRSLSVPFKALHDWTTTRLPEVEQARAAFDARGR